MLQWLKNPNVRIGLWIGIALLSIYIVYELYRITRFRRTLPEKPLIVNIQPSMPSLPQQDQSVVQPTTASIHIEAADVEYYKNDMMREFEERSKFYEDPKAKKQRDHENNQQIVNGIAQGYVFGSQTVHDTTVQSTIKNIYKEEVEKTGDKPLDLDNTIQRSIINFMRQSDLPRDQYDKVEKALSEIQKRNASLFNLDGEREGSVVARVWAGGNDNVKRQLLNELVDANTETEGIYCPTGVVTRVLQATQIEHPEAMPRTRENLREEMMNTAARVRNEMEQTPEYKGFSETEQTAKFKEKLVETYNKDYDGIVAKDIVEAEMSQWIDAV